DGEMVERDDRAVARLDPEQFVRLAAVGHGENAGRIALEQKARIEATHGASLSSPELPGEDESQNLPHLVLRTAEAGAVGRFDQRALDQDRMLDYRLEHLVVR